MALNNNRFPANSNSVVDYQGLTKKLLRHLKSSAGHSAFFDRAVKPNFEVESRELFVDFWVKTDVNLMALALEKLIKKHYLPLTLN